MDKQYNYGIDLLRIISMVFVIILHVLGFGGILGSVNPGTMQYNVSYFLKIAAFCAVDCFALISGFVGYTKEEKSFSLVPLITLWIRVIFLSSLTCIIVSVFGQGTISAKELIKSFMPFSFGTYWYFNAYVGLLLIKPFVDKIIRNTSDKILKESLIVIFFVFTLFALLARTLSGYHPFDLAYGYSMTWVIILYYVGGVIKKCEIQNLYSTKQCLSTVLLCITITFCWFLATNDTIPALGLDFRLTFIDYTSPTIFLISVMYLFMFSRIHISSKIARIIAVIAPGVFSAYIVNMQPLFVSVINTSRFAFLANASPITLFFAVIMIAVLFVLCIALLDIGRVRLFKLVHIRELSTWLNNQLKNFVRYWAKLLKLN